MSISNVRRIALSLTILAVVFAGVLSISRNAKAAAICSPATAVNVPFAKDGVGDVCLQVTSLCGYINSWNLTTLEINGTAYTNTWANGSSIAAVNGGYTIHYVGPYAWSHFEIGGTCSTVPPTTVPPTVVPPTTVPPTTVPPTAGPSLTRTRTSTAGPTATRTRTPTAGASLTPSRTATRTNTVVPTTVPPTTVPPTTVPTTIVPTVVPTTGPTAIPGTHLANPFVGAKFYVNNDWKGSTTFPTTNTFLWMDSIAAVNGTGLYKRSLAGHLDLALAQGANAVSMVIYDLPNRDCSALSSNGELLIANNGTARYRTEYIDNIYNVINQAKYSGLRFIFVIEPDSLPNLITNTSFVKCQAAMSATDGYVVNTQYTLNKFYPMRNVYSYIDVGHAGWLGWPSNFGPFVTLVSNMVKGTTNGVKSIDGFVDNTANTQVETETYLNATTMVGGNPVRSGSFFDWNDYIDESHYAAALQAAFQAAGLPAANTNFILDTSRNGWGGCGGGPYALQTCRPTKTSTSTVLDTYINESRIDRRPAKGNWCNQNGAGIGKMPGAGTAPYQWYVWVKPPGESDGSSYLIPTGPDNPDGKGLDGMCDPTYMGNSLNENQNSNALPNAPLSGAWFQAQFDQLIANKYP